MTPSAKNVHIAIDEHGVYGKYDGHASRTENAQDINPFLAKWFLSLLYPGRRTVKVVEAFHFDGNDYYNLVVQ